MLLTDGELSHVSPQQARELIRSGAVTRPTSGIASGYVQANLAFVPTRFADDFEQLCNENPAPLPLIERLPAGSTIPRCSAQNADLATDTGRYMKFNGSEWTSAQRLDPSETAGATAFIIGCSFTAERALLTEGVELKQIDSTGGVPVYRTDIRLHSAPNLEGHLVVSMRAIKKNQVERAQAITAEFPVAHGGPVHIGSGAAIGCGDGQEPDWGVPMAVGDDEVPVFWACGVTPQTVIEESNLPWAFVHAPGHMFITDIAENDVRGRSTEEIRMNLEEE